MDNNVYYVLCIIIIYIYTYVFINLWLYILGVFNDKVDSKASKLTIKLLRRVKQHAYAEPKYLGALVGNGYEKLILLIKIVSGHQRKYCLYG